MSKSAPKHLVGRFLHCINTFWNDTSGLMLPYVTVMLPVLVGFGLLALDGARYMSLQTQMQEAADALALAGARELNQQSGAQTRAIDAMANAYGSASVEFAVGDG
jgi:Flp pilus assembly protein TadG